MIKFSATNALVHDVTPVIQVTDNFQKRELILDDSWDRDGSHYTNFVSVEFTGERMSQLDSIYPGQRVNVEGMLSGREWNGRILNSVRGSRVTPYQPQQAPAYPQQYGGYQQQPQQMPQQPPQPQYPQQPQQPAYPQQPQYPANPPQQYAHPASPGVEDLPFIPQ